MSRGFWRCKLCTWGLQVRLRGKEEDSLGSQRWASQSLSRRRSIVWAQEHGASAAAAAETASRDQVGAPRPRTARLGARRHTARLSQTARARPKEPAQAVAVPRIKQSAHALPIAVAEAISRGWALAAGPWAAGRREAWAWAAQLRQGVEIDRLRKRKTPIAKIAWEKHLFIWTNLKWQLDPIGFSIEKSQNISVSSPSLSLFCFLY